LSAIALPESVDKRECRKARECAVWLCDIPKDLTHAPREFAERFFNIARWTEVTRGGNFAALEEPELLANEMRAFFKELQTNSISLKSS